MASGEPFVSVIVATYNWPRALDLVLGGLAAQTATQFEVIVADDGSGPETARLVARRVSRFPVPLRHVWQEDRGMRLSRIRNLSASVAQGDFFLFLDGDGLVLPGLVAAHKRRAEIGWMNSGRRCNLSPRATRWALQGWLVPHRVPVPVYRKIMKATGDVQFVLELSPRRGRRVTEAERKQAPFAWKNIFGAHLGIWRQDYLAVGGCDESYVGWGSEDSDLIVRLNHAGIRIMQLPAEQPVLHLDHPRRSDRSLNAARFEDVLRSMRTQPVASMLMAGSGRTEPEPGDRV